MARKRYRDASTAKLGFGMSSPAKSCGLSKTSPKGRAPGPSPSRPTASKPSRAAAMHVRKATAPHLRCSLGSRHRQASPAIQGPYRRCPARRDLGRRQTVALGELRRHHAALGFANRQRTPAARRPRQLRRVGDPHPRRQAGGLLLRPWRAGDPQVRSVHLWDLTTGKELKLFKGHRGRADTVARNFRRRRAPLVSGSADGTHAAVGNAEVSNW